MIDYRGQNPHNIATTVSAILTVDLRAEDYTAYCFPEMVGANVNDGNIFRSKGQKASSECHKSLSRHSFQIFGTAYQAILFLLITFVHLEPN